MPDLEFLPSWYTQLQRRWHVVRVESLLTVALVGALALWMVLAGRNRAAAETALASMQAQLADSQADLQQMHRLETLISGLKQKDQILRRVGGAKWGTHVEATQLIGRLEQIVPPGVSLLGLELEMAEVPVPVSGISKAAAASENAAPAVKRQLRVRLQGVAPNDVELAEFLTELNKVSFFDQVTPTYVRDRREGDKALRQFELTFTVSLNEPGN